MSEAEFLKEDNLQFCLDHAIEECGEFLAAAGKTSRWGFSSVNPLIPAEEQEFNSDWLRREMKDVREALARLERVMTKEGF